MKDQHKNQIFFKLDQYLPKEQTIVVGVSGGPDSMMLIYILQEYYKSKGWKQANICVAHFNHGQRKESKKELSSIKKLFSYNTIYRNLVIPKKGLSETKLRNLRHEFFEEVLIQSKSNSLYLGHNLSDRIETSLLNIVRGCSIDGFLSIKNTQKKKNYTIYRPLLDLPKNTIQNICDTQKISYFIDTTNQKPITPRNIVRNTILPELYKLHSGGEKNWNSSRSMFYNNKEELILPWEKHTPHILRGATTRQTLPIKDITAKHLVNLYKDTYYITQKTITSLLLFFTTGSGYMYVGGWYFFVVGGKIHCINGYKNFWKQKHTLKKVLKGYGKQNFNGYIFNCQKERIGNTIRYPKEGDTYKNKRLLKYMLNKKIPVFMRNTIPVISNKQKITAVLY